MDGRIEAIIETHEADPSWAIAYYDNGKVVDATNGLHGVNALRIQAILQYSHAVGVEIVTGADTYIYDELTRLWYGADRFGLFTALVFDPKYALGSMLPRTEDYNAVMTKVHDAKQGWLAREARPDKERNYTE
jgi:hypothetical protein